MVDMHFYKRLSKLDVVPWFRVVFRAKMIDFCRGDLYLGDGCYMSRLSFNRDIERLVDVVMVADILQEVEDI